MYTLNFEDVIMKITDGVATLYINREAKLNALNSDVLEHLYSYLSSLENNPDVKIVVLTGVGNRAFAAGADLAEIRDTADIGQFRDYYAKFDRVYQKIASMPQPVIARVNGYAFGGGCLLAVSCDLVVATEKSSFSQPEVDFGFTGGAMLFPKLVGRQIASEITFLGKPFSAADAYRWNLVNRVVKEEDLDADIQNLCESLLKKSPYALNMIKKCIASSFDVGLAAGNKFETELSAICLNTQDSKERISRFVEKTKNK